jgi:hypothetical protein
MPVGVRHSLPELADHADPRRERKRLTMIVQPQVEPAEAVIARIDQPYPQVVQITGAQHAVVMQPAGQVALALGELPRTATLRFRGPRPADEEPDAGFVPAGEPVLGQPVLPAVALSERSTDQRQEPTSCSRRCANPIRSNSFTSRSSCLINPGRAPVPDGSSTRWVMLGRPLWCSRPSSPNRSVASEGGRAQRQFHACRKMQCWM